MAAFSTFAIKSQTESRVIFCGSAGAGAHSGVLQIIDSVHEIVLAFSRFTENFLRFNVTPGDNNKLFAYRSQKDAKSKSWQYMRSRRAGAGEKS